jgi:hypothetical protein
MIRLLDQLSSLASILVVIKELITEYFLIMLAAFECGQREALPG